MTLKFYSSVVKVSNKKSESFRGYVLESTGEKLVVGVERLFVPLPPPPILNRVNRATVNVSALSSTKIDKYEYLTGDEILLSNQTQIIEQSKFAYSLLKNRLVL